MRVTGHSLLQMLCRPRRAVSGTPAWLSQARSGPFPLHFLQLKAAPAPAGRSPMFQLTATPASALSDEPVHIRATGLPPLRLVTLAASLRDEKGHLYRSRAFYRADEAGELDLRRAPSVGGDYVGVHPMGLFWSLKPERPFGRLMKRDVSSPFVVTLDLYDSVCSQDPAPARPRASRLLQRWFLRPGTQRVPIREGRVRGALFLPPGEGPFPGVVDLFGGVGGLIEFRASLLAARGFAVLALAYFAYDDLPSQMQELDLEYFEEAADLLLAHPKVRGPGIGVLSVSKGAEIGLAMACFLKQVAAAVCINGPNAVCDLPFRYRGLLVPPMPSFLERMQVHVSGAVSLLHFRGDAQEEKLNRRSVLPIEKARGQILFVTGEDDQVCNSKGYAQQALEQLKSHGRSNGRVLAYPGAGHLLEPPYAPLCYASRIYSVSAPTSHNHPLANTRMYAISQPLLWGGDPEAHAAAQEHAWGEIQKFFRQHLPQARSQL